ncbi:MAG: hypothetical protein KAR20_25175, partial [Candidatus Heimdallarchaeota archaeon]|nr:hypothetical protein [Candidatus Heimdallarchaeota archaeon]
LDGFAHGLDIYVEAALFRFAKLLIKFLDYQGLSLRLHWLFNESEQIIDTPELFSVMFLEDTKLGIFESIKHDKPSEIVDCISSRAPFDKWIVVLPPFDAVLQFPDFSDFYKEIIDKSRLHIVKLHKKSQLSEIIPTEQYQNYTELNIPAKIDKHKNLQTFDELVKLLFNIVI